MCNEAPGRYTSSEMTVMLEPWRRIPASPRSTTASSRAALPRPSTHLIRSPNPSSTGASRPEIGRAHAELQSRPHLVCRLLLEKKKKKHKHHSHIKKKKNTTKKNK